MTMPILAREPSLYPGHLLDAQVDEDSDRSWWVLHTKVRQEKALARQLNRYEIPFFLPLIAKDNLIRGSRVRSYLPLFPSYVFLYGNEAERVKSLVTNRVADVLTVPEQLRFRGDLQHIYRLILADAPLTLERRLIDGQAVRIKKGCFAGIEGVVTTRRGRTKLLVSVRFLGQGVSVEIDDLLVEAI